MQKLDDLLKHVVKNVESKSNYEHSIAVAVAQDRDVLLSIDEAALKGFGTAYLVGDEIEIRTIASEIEMNLEKHKIINETDKVSACEIATRLVSQGKAKSLMKGLVDTSIILKAALNKEYGLRTDSVMSHVSVFEIDNYHKLLFVTDAAINIKPDFETKINIIENTVKSLHNLGIEKPKVALVCAKEKVNPKMQSTVDAYDLQSHFESREDCIVEGPIALDGAVSKEACEIKGIKSKVGGDADVILVDNIEAGNALYKSLTYLAGCKNGGVVLGTKEPIILTSRADSAESKLISIALGLSM